jgi:hypothetical protein
MAAETGFAVAEPELRSRAQVGSVSRRAVRAAGVAAAWAFAVLPAAIGSQRCAFATILHWPCPGCGMTRAIHLLQAGEIGASLRMNPFATPVIAVGAMLMLSTFLTTLASGSPIEFYKTRLGRVALASAAFVYAAAFVFWALRWLGFFGGPVPVG